MLGAFLSGLSKIGSMGVKKAAAQGAKEFAKGKAKDFVTGKGRKKKKRKGGGGNYDGGGDSGDITPRRSSAIVPTTPIVPGALARPEDVEYKESDRDKSVTLDSIANQLASIVALTETLEKIVKKQYKGKKKATEKERVAKDKKKKQEREEKQENRILGGVSAVGRRISNQFNLVNFFTQMLLGTLAIFLVKNIDKIVGALKFTQENLSLVLKSIFSLFKGFQLLKPKFLKAIKSGKEAISNFAKPIKNAFKSVGSGIKQLFKRIGDLIPNIIKQTLRVVGGAAKAVAGAPGKLLRSLNPSKAQQGARATKSVIQRYSQRFGRGAAESKFGNQKVVGAVGKGFVGRKVDAAGKFVKKGATKVSVGATRGVQSIAKKFGMSAKLAKKLRIPVIGPLITAVASLLSGEPIQQALFKASGAALGGILGTLIPIPVVGTLIGELIGEYFGDLAYTLFMGGGISAVGERLKKDITNVMSMGETALKWAGDGFERFYEGIPKFKLPDLGWGNAAAYGSINLLLGATTGKKIQDVEIPNPLWMVNPTNIMDKLGIFYKAFFTRDAMDGSDTKEVETSNTEESTPQLMTENEYYDARVENPGLPDTYEEYVSQYESNVITSPDNKPVSGDIQPGGSIEVTGDGSGSTGKLIFKDSSGKRVGKAYDAISGVFSTAGTSQEQRKNVSGSLYPLPDGAYPLLDFQKHGYMKGIGEWSTYINNSSGSIGSRSQLLIHNDIGSNGTAGCIGVELGGKSGTPQEKEFIKMYNMVQPKSVKVSLSKGVVSEQTLPNKTSDNKEAKPELSLEPKREDFGPGRSGGAKYQKAKNEYEKAKVEPQTKGIETPEPKPKREDFGSGRSGAKNYQEAIKKYEESKVVEESTPSPSSPPISPPRQQSTTNIERQASYDQPSESSTVVMAPPAPQQSPSQGGSSGGGSMMATSTEEVLNSYYKRQLLGFLYKQG